MSGSCKTCMYLEPIDGIEGGYCRRYPPTVLSDDDGDGFELKPVVRVGDWCGEYKEAIDPEALEA